MKKKDISLDELKMNLANIAVEEWRFKSVFQRMLDELDPFGGSKYLSKYNWFSKQVNIAIQESGLKVINYDGKRFEIGMAVTPINIDEFEEGKDLYIDRMVEPIIMDNGKIIKTGSVILRG